MFNTAHSLQAGETITLTAWSYLDFTAKYTDLLNLLAALRTQTEDLDTTLQSLLNRVLSSSISPEDLENVSVADVPGILEGIFTLNKIEDMAAKPLGLQQRVLQAIESAIGITPAS